MEWQDPASMIALFPVGRRRRNSIESTSRRKRHDSIASAGRRKRKESIESTGRRRVLTPVLSLGGDSEEFEASKEKTQVAAEKARLERKAKVRPSVHPLGSRRNNVDWPLESIHFPRGPSM